VPHAFVLLSPWETYADVHYGAGAVAAAARSAATSLAAQAACEFVADAVAGCEEAVAAAAAAASSANRSHWASAGAAAVHRVVNLVAVDALCAKHSAAAVGAGRAPAAATAEVAAHAAVTADDLRTSLIVCRSLHSELLCSLAHFLRLRHYCPRAVPDTLPLRAWNQPVAQHAEWTDEFCQTAVGSLHH